MLYYGPVVLVFHRIVSYSGDILAEKLAETLQPRRRSRILQGRVSNPSERGTGGRAPPPQLF